MVTGDDALGISLVEGSGGSGTRDSGGEAEVKMGLEIVLELARKANPDAIAELIAGSSVDEVLASVEPAREAYARVYAEAAEAEREVRPPAVPAGGSMVGSMDVERLPTAEKMRRGLQRQHKGVRG